MLNVLFTFDTEAYPRTAGWRERRLSSELDREVFGLTAYGEFGIRYQAQLLRSCGLKGVFFVESLFASIVGLDPLRSIVKAIQDHGQEVQLHVHTEWLEHIRDPLLPSHFGYNIREFSVEEQVQLIERGRHNLEACGAQPIQAFRAGNFGANLDTLHALARARIPMDSSYNACALNGDCAIQTDKLLLQPERIAGVTEFPLSFFSDWPGHYRPVQLCACSNQELEHSLIQAWREGWYSFVILSHSFELVNNRRMHHKACLPNRTLVRRFRNLCRFLADHPDKFHTVHFSELASTSIPILNPEKPLRSAPHRTALRAVEQVLSRII